MRSFSDEIVSPTDIKPSKLIISLITLDISLNVLEILNSIFHWV
jgi:hypothetical protein